MNELSGLTRTANRKPHLDAKWPAPSLCDSRFEGATALADLSEAED